MLCREKWVTFLSYPGTWCNLKLEVGNQDKNQVTQMQEVDLCLSRGSGLWPYSVNIPGEVIISCLTGKGDCQLNGRIWDLSPCDFTLTLQLIARILILPWSSHTFYWCLWCCGNFVETWNVDLNSWMILFISSVIKAQRYFLINDYNFTYTALQAQASSFNMVAKVFIFMSW